MIARQLGLDLYASISSRVVSKWLGETEKNLGEVFDAAEPGHVVLLFNEADSLFGKRTEVKSRNDRYANMETNYLLQRLEQFGGLAILTTNLGGAIDPAFRRRFAYDVQFTFPDPEMRAELWRRDPADRAGRGRSTSTSSASASSCRAASSRSPPSARRSRPRRRARRCRPRAGRDHPPDVSRARQAHPSAGWSDMQAHEQHARPNHDDPRRLPRPRSPSPRSRRQPAAQNGPAGGQLRRAHRPARGRGRPAAQDQVQDQPLANTDAVIEQLAHGMVAKELDDKDEHFLAVNGYEALPIIRGVHEFVMRTFLPTQAGKAADRRVPRHRPRRSRPSSPISIRPASACTSSTPTAR